VISLDNLSKRQIAFLSIDAVVKKPPFGGLFLHIAVELSLGLLPQWHIHPSFCIDPEIVV